MMDNPVSAAALDATATPEPNWRAWVIATLLAACYTLSYFDRQAISILVAPIKKSLSLSDTQFGLLQGISFSVFYVAACLPLAWLADRLRRSRVMSGCVAFWSLMTMLCELRTNFWQLLLARIGLASAESGLTPAALATLSARFDPRRLATATSMFMLAPFVGGGLALSGGGALYESVKHWNRAGLPLLSHFEDWQIVFFLVGLPGFVAAALTTAALQRAVFHEVPLGRTASMREVAEAVAWFALSAPWITGECVHVDGGMHVRRPLHPDEMQAALRAPPDQT
jgi:MFS family permease